MNNITATVIYVATQPNSNTYNNSNNEREKENSNMKREKLLVKFKWIQHPLPCYLVNALSIFVFFYENGNREEKKNRKLSSPNAFLVHNEQQRMNIVGFTNNTKVEIQFPPPAKIVPLCLFFIRYSTAYQL